MKLITSYQNPDLDGTACTYAYAEYLGKRGEDVQPGIFGEIHREAQFVMDTFRIAPMTRAEDIIGRVEEIVLTDASDARGISDQIDVQRVVEIIDHRKAHEAYTFPNARAQIELVGSAATLVAEKFFENGIDITKASAVLLYSAIVSNTINFQAHVTTPRDNNMASWLKEKIDLPENYIHDMFLDKSKFRKSLKETIVDDFACTMVFGGHTLGIAQFEIVQVDAFIQENHDELIALLRELRNERSLDHIFLTCIDLEKAYNTFLVIEDSTKNMLEHALEVKFKKGIAGRKGIIMRKEIIPILKEILESR